jgi:hypothetical protein
MARRRVILTRRKGETKSKPSNRSFITSWLESTCRGGVSCCRARHPFTRISPPWDVRYTRSLRWKSTSGPFFRPCALWSTIYRLTQMLMLCWRVACRVFLVTSLRNDATRLKNKRFGDGSVEVPGRGIPVWWSIIQNSEETFAQKKSNRYCTSSQLVCNGKSIEL